MLNGNLRVNALLSRPFYPFDCLGEIVDLFRFFEADVQNIHAPLAKHVAGAFFAFLLVVSQPPFADNLHSHHTLPGRVNLL